MIRPGRCALLVLLGGIMGCAPAGPVVATAPAPRPSPPPVTAKADPIPPRGLHLPRTALPTKYAVELDVRTDETKLSGAVTIDLTLDSATDVVWLHGRNLAVRDAHFEVGGQMLPARVVADAKNERLGFVAASSMPAGGARLFVRYDAEVLGNSDRGVFREQEGGDWYVFSQFENTDARSAFPCFDEPNVKTPWVVTLEVGASQVALSNTQPATEQATRPGRKKIRFTETQPLPAYLVAFAVGPFDLVDAGKAGQAKIPVRIAVPRGAAREAAYAAQITGDLVGILEEYFGIPYPYDKLDVVPVPTLITWGAMENAGLITFFREGMLARAGEDSEAFKRRYASIMAHEIAHQWFGDLVTMQWWDDIWLNEGFATWITNKAIAKYRPEWNIDVARVRDDSKAMVSDSLVSARRIRQPIESPDDIANAFDAITYEKGAAVLGMFESWIGEEKFRRGIHDYLKRHAHGNATSRDFFAAISENAGLDVAPAFSSFLDQPGVPLLAPASECKPGDPKLLLAQERYLPIGSKGDPARTWIVPVCMRSAGSLRQTSHSPTPEPSDQVCGLLQEPKGEVPLPADACSAPLVRNAGARGYYIASYTPAVLDKLFRGGEKKLSLPERIALLRDIGALLVGGKLSAAEVLGRLGPIANDANPSVVRGALAWLEEFTPAVVPPEIAPKFSRFVQRIMGPRARTLGFSPKPNDDPETRFLRPLVLTFVANRGQDPVLVTEAKARARRWLGGDATSTADEVVDAVLSIAAAHGDRAFFEQLHAAAKQTSDVKRRRRLLQAMGQFRDPAIVEAAFEIALSNEFDIRDALSLFEHDKVMDPVIFRLLKRHYDDIRKRLPSEVVGTLPELVQGLCSEDDRNAVEAFFKERSEQELGGPRRLAHTLEFISICSAFRAHQAPSLTKFLAKN
jgi:cytosol alanyl aminopeptidase